jgi:HEAT repeat protein
MTTRKIKAKVLSLLKAGADWGEFAVLGRTALVNGLLAALSRPEEEVRYRDGVALGRIAAEMAEEDLEPVRNIMRRLVWFQNDESGAVGWGAAEAMAEIMARVPEMAKEFSAVLVFMLRDDSNCPDFGPLVKSNLRAVGRIAQADRSYAAGAAQHLDRFFRDPDPEIRVLAAWVAGLVGEGEAREGLEPLTQDKAEVRMFRAGGFESVLVREAAATALARLTEE